MNFAQNYQVEHTEYSLITVDAQLALYGGYSALMWQILSILLSWYQQSDYTA